MLILSQCSSSGAQLPWLWWSFWQATLFLKLPLRLSVLEWWDVEKRLAWALFVLLFSTLVCYQPTELILGFLLLLFLFFFRNFPILPPPPPQHARRCNPPWLLRSLRPLWRMLNLHLSWACRLSGRNSAFRERGVFYYCLCFVCFFVFVSICWRGGGVMKIYIYIITFLGFGPYGQIEMNFCES